MQQPDFLHSCISRHTKRLDGKPYVFSPNLFILGTYWTAPSFDTATVHCGH